MRPIHALGLVSLVALAVAGCKRDHDGAVATPPATPAFALTAVAPTSGPFLGGTVLTLTGSGFVSGSTVDVGGALATAVVVVSGSRITCITPAGAVGPASVTITKPNAATRTLANAFTFMGNAPTLTAISPAIGPMAGGTTVTLTGTGFYPGATVTIGGVAATVGTVTTTSIVATTGSASAGAATVTVTNLDGQSASLASGFTYLAPPTLTGLSPASGPDTGGTTVTLTGTGFVAGATVQFGSTLGTSVTVSSATSLTVVSPNVSPFTGLVTVTLTNPDGQAASLVNGWTWLGPAPAPTVVSPVAGPNTGGQSVYISGANFLPGATVTLNGVAATVVTLSNTSIVCTTASTATTGQGNVVVTNPDAQTGTLTNGWTWLGPPPTLTAISPTSGTNGGGTLVTLTGTGFVTGSVVRVEYWNGTSVTIVSGTSITCRTPNVSPGIGSGNVTVVNPDGQIATLPSAFLFVGPAPGLSAATVNPTSGPTGGGTLVTIAGGTNFDTGATVTFGGQPATGVTLVSASSITCYTPAGTGSVGITVTNIDGTSGSLSSAYTYVSGLGLVSVAPASGAVSGGTLVTLTGTGFSSGDTVTFAGAAATGVTIVSATRITCLTPAGSLGAADVTVTDTGSTASTLPAGYAYINGVNAQTAAFAWDTSVGIDHTRRWYVNMNFPSFLKDLQNRGLQSWGTPGDTTTPPAALPLVDQYAHDWMRAYVLRTMSIVYGRNPDGSKVSGQSVNVTFCGLTPAAGTPAGSNPATDYAEIGAGGCGASNGGTHPSASQTTTGCSGGVIGTAPYDTTASQGCNSYAEHVANRYYHNCPSCSSSLGIFVSNIGNAWGQSLSGGQLASGDQQYLDGTTNGGTRYTQIHDFMKQFARRIAFVAAHEMGHAMGLAGDGTVGTCRRSTGQCGATAAHTACCSTNLMAPTLGLGGSSTDYSRGLDGNPDPANPSRASSCGSPVTSWQVLQAYLGVAP